MEDGVDKSLAESIRAFNRFYTETIGALNDRHEGLDVTIAESRLLFTVREFGATQPGRLAGHLRLDLAYTSRLLGRLEDAKLVRRTLSTTDRRQRVVVLTARGTRLLDEIERRSNTRVLQLVAHLDDTDVQTLLDAFGTIHTLLAKEETIS